MVIEAVKGPIEPFAARVSRTRALLESKGADALVAFAAGGGRADVKYLTDYPSSLTLEASPRGTQHMAVVIPAHGGGVLVVSGESDVHQVAGVAEIRSGHELSTEIAAVLEEIGGESGRVAVTGLEDLPPASQDSFRAALPRANVIDGRELMDAQRVIKSEWEADLLRTAARVGDSALKAGVEALAPAILVRDVAAAVADAATTAGADRIARVRVLHGSCIDALSASDTGATALENGDLVQLEVSGWCAAYGFSNARIASVGRPSREQSEYLEHALEATEWMTERLKPRVATEFVLTESRGREITPAGSGLGLEIGEAPWLIPGRPFTLQPRMVLSVSPAVTSQRFGSVTIKDTVRITEAGCERLSAYPLRTW